ncbi:MAG: hypothetical protein JNJ81_10855 [Candidatus Accumulibacter sp.]|nr:hypothetical protein [Accumulibacter sp.]
MTSGAIGWQHGNESSTYPTPIRSSVAQRPRTEMYSMSGELWFFDTKVLVYFFRQAPEKQAAARRLWSRAGDLQDDQWIGQLEVVNPFSAEFAGRW